MHAPKPWSHVCLLPRPFFQHTLHLRPSSTPPCCQPANPPVCPSVHLPLALPTLAYSTGRRGRRCLADLPSSRSLPRELHATAAFHPTIVGRLQCSSCPAVSAVPAESAVPAVSAALTSCMPIRGPLLLHLFSAPPQSPVCRRRGHQSRCSKRACRCHRPTAPCYTVPPQSTCLWAAQKRQGKSW